MMNQTLLYGSRTPSESPNQTTAAQWIGRALAAVTGKLKVVDHDADVEMRDRVRHVLKPNEKMLEFYARTGLGRAQILTMQRDEISRFVENAERNRAEEALPTTIAMQAKQPPNKLLISTW